MMTAWQRLVPISVLVVSEVICRHFAQTWLCTSYYWVHAHDEVNASEPIRDGL
jgi:hypothetical protein